MGVINAINETSSKAFDSGETYIKVSKEYYKLKIFQQLTRFFSFFSKLAIIGGLLFLGLIFLTVSGAIWLGQLIGNTALACLLLALTIFLFTGIVYLIRKKIDKSIINKMSQEFFN